MGDVDLTELKEIQLDGLKEVANIGAGHAATALSQMTGHRIMVDVPRLDIAPLEEITQRLADPEDVAAAVLMHVLGDLTGRSLLFLPSATASHLCAILLGREAASPASFGEMERSALKEVGNIVTGAYMNALSDFMGLMLLPSVPSLEIDLGGAVLTTAFTNFGDPRDRVFCVETRFAMEEQAEALRGYFVLLPDVDSLQVILEAIRLA